ncbi:Protein of unknown function [Leuconostoc citreum]|nr:Protein of unknown function [Leuconostoc citreum LBAE C10]CCF26023.1 Protein of unknown function [Leuconostoc citreum LBAE C11]CCF27835.1 Protein of unknown function [Leuconostoc citreum LBAE E16]CDX67120.1 Protein of unknown function [Leuconostoc citreum]
MAMKYIKQLKKQLNLLIS